MAGMEDVAEVEVAAASDEVQIKTNSDEILFVSADTPFDRVLECDAEGVRIVFEHEKDLFKPLSAEEVIMLSHDTRVSYSMSKALNARHDPDNDELQQRLKVVEMRDRRSEFEGVVRNTPQSMLATKKLQAFVGNGFSPFWARTDKIEQRLQQGYEIVDARKDGVFAGVAASGNADQKGSHFETRIKPGEAELVLMRVPNERKAEIMAAKQEAAKRQDSAMTSVGKRDLAALGAKAIDGRDDLPWSDRR